MEGCVGVPGRNLKTAHRLLLLEAKHGPELDGNVTVQANTQLPGPPGEMNEVVLLRPNEKIRDIRVANRFVQDGRGHVCFRAADQHVVKTPAQNAKQLPESVFAGPWGRHTKAQPGKPSFTRRQ